MNLRTATPADLAALTAVEHACFPPAEAATKQQLSQRLEVYPYHFWLLEDEGKLVAFLDGMVTDEPTIRDEMFADVSMHNEQGAWQTIFGLNTLPEYRRQGCAARLLEAMTEDARDAGRRGCILTCKEPMLHYYEKFGYRNLGVSRSVHGGAVWYDMMLEF